MITRYQKPWPHLTAAISSSSAWTSPSPLSSWCTPCVPCSAAPCSPTPSCLACTSRPAPPWPRPVRVGEAPKQLNDLVDRHYWSLKKKDAYLVVLCNHGAIDGGSHGVGVAGVEPFSCCGLLLVFLRLSFLWNKTDEDRDMHDLKTHKKNKERFIKSMWSISRFAIASPKRYCV